MSNNIEHIVYLMLENRSLDHLLGWLYKPDEKYKIIPEPEPGSTNILFNGLYTGKYSNTYKGKNYPATQISPEQGQQIPDVDPHEPFEHVKVQIKNNMQGFVADFADKSLCLAQIMECYTPQSLKCINYLAKTYAVSDVYFSSIPTQTNCNRAFSLTGNSIGSYYDFKKTKVAMVDNHWTILEGGPGQPYEFTERTIWNVLSDNGYDNPEKDWSVFYSQKWPGLSFDEGNYCFTQDLLWPSLKDKISHFKNISDFFSLAELGNLPKFSYLEPVWYEQEYDFGHTGTDYHPPGNLAPGEKFLNKIYNVLKASPKWEKTLFIINFDEHGGTYDHVEPPATISPWENPEDGTAKPELSPEHPFDFKKLGVRVPLILVSPLIEKSTVFRPKGSGVFDHTSVIATILNYFDIPKEKWKLGSRTAHAYTFENVIGDIVVNDNNKGCFSVEDSNQPIHEKADENSIEANDLQKMIGERYVWRRMLELNFSEDKIKSLINNHFTEITTMGELNNAMKSILKKM